MFDRKKFEAIVNKEFDLFFNLCKEDDFFDSWYENNLNMEEQKRSYNWERAVKLSIITKHVKSRVTEISSKLDDMYDANVVCWDDNDKYSKWRLSLGYSERKRKETEYIVEILPIMAELYELNQIVDEIGDYWKKYATILINMRACFSNDKSQESIDLSKKFMWNEFESYCDVMFDRIIESYPQFNSDKYRTIFDSIKDSDDNSTRWVEIYIEYFTKKILDVINALEIFEFLKTQKPNIDRYFGVCHRFPNSIYFPREAQTPEVCNKLLEMYTSGIIEGFPTQQDFEKIIDN